MPINIIAFAGSLRQKSYNRSLLHYAKSVAPTDIEIEIADLLSIPLYNGDLEDQGTPQSVLDLKAKIEAAHGILIVTPEYNRSVPGVLKNTIDWLSRPPKNVFDGKPVALMGASDGGFGTIQAQTHLRATLPQIGAWVLPKPNVYMRNADEKFDANGTLTDEATKKSVQDLLTTYAAWLSRAA